MKNLVLVEASGKIDVLTRALRAIGIPAEVMATVGHVAQNPHSLAKIGLDAQLRETSYQFRDDRMHLLEKIQRAAAIADKIYLAMDDDQEGDVIAHDIAWVLSDHESKLSRVRLRALSEAELGEAFRSAGGHDLKLAANNGICRRVVDRAIGAAFSVVANDEVISVGRVQSSLLATLAEDLPEIGAYTVVFPAGQTERLYASVPVKTVAERERLDQLQSAVIAGVPVRVIHDRVEAAPAGVPWGFDEIVDEASARLNLTVATAAEALQEAYVRGLVSYPRAQKGGFTDDAVELAARLARQNKTQFDSAVVPRRSPGSSAHEPPRPMDEDMLLGRAFSLMEIPEAVAVIVARNMLACGQMHKRRVVDVEVDGLSLTLHSPLQHISRSWKVQKQEAGYVGYAPDRALLRFMRKHDLGRPSTVVQHVAKFLNRDLVRLDGADLGLNEKGRRWLAVAQSAGFTKDSSIEMERRFGASFADPYMEARSILEDAGMLPQVMRVIEAQQKREMVHEHAVQMP